ncbi:hypothetical protein O6H91_15G022000 [Diphasiastrum complanatum]|uniref:Uncharacterized protein n=1 Tax=Diphasiastrum complanatum TaxID=34168 RepID=A0ACC2BGJ8_DIPCM|nr:hypothetical protein O6H91_15G022000 [Diphasiastrum complanatum]
MLLYMRLYTVGNLLKSWQPEETTGLCNRASLQIYEKHLFSEVHPIKHGATNQAWRWVVGFSVETSEARRLIAARSLHESQRSCVGEAALAVRPCLRRASVMARYSRGSLMIALETGG